MRLVLTLLLVFGILTTVHCEAEMGSEDNPYPDDHKYDGEEGEDEDGGDESEEPGVEGEEGEEGEDLAHYEDDGKESQLTQKHLRDLHKKFDANNDGKASLHEIMAFAMEKSKAVKAKEIHGIFDEIDSTKDGHLSLEEHLAEYEAEMEEADGEQRELLKQHEIEKFKAADSDGDDKLDKHELVAFMNPETHPEVFEIHVQHIFKTQDINKDGKIDKDEWDKTVRREHEHHMDENLDHDGEFKNLDENGDGVIDFTEMKHWESGRFHIEHAMKKLFHVGDKDGDKHMTEHEMAMALDDLEEHVDTHSHLTDWVFHEEM